MALVASDHQAGMPVPIRNLNVSAVSCCGPKTKNKTKINSVFSYIHFGIEINKHLRFIKPISFWI